MLSSPTIFIPSISFNSLSAKFEPINPATPVIKTVLFFKSKFCILLAPFIFITYLQLSFRNLFSLQKQAAYWIYIEPSFLNTTNIVFNNIFISSPMFQFVIYSLSRRTTSSKSVISLRPLTCHMPVIPGLIASLARW